MEVSDTNTAICAEFLRSVATNVHQNLINAQIEYALRDAECAARRGEKCCIRSIPCPFYAYSCDFRVSSSRDPKETDAFNTIIHGVIAPLRAQGFVVLPYGHYQGSIEIRWCTK